MSPARSGSLLGEQLIFRSGAEENRFTFKSELLNSAVAGPLYPRVLVATQGFADLQRVKPDFIMPDQSLFSPAGSIELAGGGLYRYDYLSLPTDGANALYPSIDSEFIGIFQYRVSWAVAVNSARDYVALAPIDVVPVLEFYCADHDDYFLTSYPMRSRRSTLAIFRVGSVPETAYRRGQVHRPNSA